MNDERTGAVFATVAVHSLLMFRIHTCACRWSDDDLQRVGGLCVMRSQWRQPRSRPDRLVDISRETSPERLSGKN